MALWTERIQEVAGGDGAVLVWSDGKSIGGYGHVAAPSLGTGELLQLFVHPDCWRKGAGSALLNACEDLLAEQGASWAFLWVFEANANARAFYEHCGWLPDGESRLVDRGQPVLQLRYRKKLAGASC